MKIYVYLIYFPTSKKSYIGQTKDLKCRLQAHFGSGSLVCKALWKYNDWQVSILHTVKTRDEANRIEIEEIRNFNCVAPNGYNLTAGGEGGLSNKNAKGYKWSKKQLEKIQGNKNALGSKSTKGQHWKWSEESKIKIKGNKNAKYHGCPKGTKRPDVSKRNKENNPMKNCAAVLKIRIKKLRQKLRKEI